MRLAYTLSIILFASTVVAQSPYRPFPESDAAWVEEHGWLTSDGFNDFYTYSTRTIEFGTDTVVGGSTYHRLRSRGAGTATQIFPPNNSWPVVEPSRTLCLFRQDVNARQAFVYDTLAQQEVLWYDFNLGLGDYPQTWDQPSDDGHVQVVVLDSMLLNDGWHRTWVLGLLDLNNGSPTDSAFCTIVEGVGSTYGLHTVHGLMPPFEHGDDLNCHSRESLPVYPLGAAACDLSTSLVPVREEAVVLRVQPNPVAEVLTVTGPALEGARYQLMSVQGRPLQEGVLRANTIDIRAFPPATYLLRIMDGDGAFFLVRVMKL